MALPAPNEVNSSEQAMNCGYQRWNVYLRRVHLCFVQTRSAAKFLLIHGWQLQSRRESFIDATDRCPGVDQGLYASYRELR